MELGVRRGRGRGGGRGRPSACWVSSEMGSGTRFRRGGAQGNESLRDNHECVKKILGLVKNKGLQTQVLLGFLYYAGGSAQLKMLKSRYVLHILDFFGGLCFKCRKSHDEEDVPGVASGYIHKGLRLGTIEMDRLHGSEVKNLLRERKLVLILDLEHTLINSITLHDISAAEIDLGIQTGNCCIRKKTGNFNGVYICIKF